MNYVIEDGVDFWDELEKEDDASAELCLLTGEALAPNHISLKCGHAFNYTPLFNELRREKTRHNPKEVQRVRTDQIKCPYCRQVQTGLLPFVPTITTERLRGVNAPEKHTLRLCGCGWTMKNGKRSGEVCGANAFQTGYGNRCEKHWRAEERNAKLASSWTAEMQAVCDKSKRVDLIAKLRAQGRPVYGNKKVLVERLFKA